MLQKIKSLFRPFRSSDYWENRYKQGGNSGTGSYNELADYKASVINDLLKEKSIQSAIEWGCGDGNQLSLIQYPKYLGFDVSPTALEICRKKFEHDPSKTFKHAAEYNEESADLSLSLDVIYHLVEHHVYFTHLSSLFRSSKKWVLIFSSDHHENDGLSEHVKHRKFTADVKEFHPDWTLVKVWGNPHPFKGDYNTGTTALFHLYEKSSNHL